MTSVTIMFTKCGVAARDHNQGLLGWEREWDGRMGLRFPSGGEGNWTHDCATFG